MKYVLGLMLLLVSCCASAEYELTIRDNKAQTTTVFESCEMGFYSHSPGVLDGAFLYMQCSNDGKSGHYSPGVWSHWFAQFEEVGIGAGPGGKYIERFDCYLVFMRHENYEGGTGEKGRIMIECGDMHFSEVYKSGFEGAS